MPEFSRNHPLANAPGLFAFALWSVYSSYVAFSYAAGLTSVFIGGVFGAVACLAALLNFTYWRSTVLLASSIY